MPGLAFRVYGLGSRIGAWVYQGSRDFLVKSHSRVLLGLLVVYKPGV